MTGALQLQNITQALRDYKVIDSSCSLTTPQGAQTKCSPSSVPLAAFRHCSQADFWTRNDASSGTNPAWASTALLPRRRPHCHSPALQPTSACSTSSVEVPPRETKASQTMTHNYLVVCWPWASQVWIRFCDSINNKLIFHSCQTKEPERLKLTLILAHTCPFNLAASPALGYLYTGDITEVFMRRARSSFYTSRPKAQHRAERAATIPEAWFSTPFHVSWLCNGNQWSYTARKLVKQRLALTPWIGFSSLVGETILVYICQPGFSFVH